jgi:hypothetical protein
MTGAGKRLPAVSAAVLVAVWALGSRGFAAGAPAATGSAAAGAPPKLLRIDWREGPEYPLGIQDSVLGVVGKHLVSAGGFSRHPKDVVRLFPDAFGGEKSGFTGIAFAMERDREAKGWQRIPNIPGAPRQGAAMAVVDGTLYAVGGFSYTDPWTYRDGYRLRRRGGEWNWEKLPEEFPWPVCEAGTAVVGSKLYILGEADFFQAAGAEGNDFHSEAGRTGSPVGRALLELDTRHPERGWRRLPDCPGVPVFDNAVAGARGKLYLLGGIFAPAGTRKPQYYNSIQSWSFDLKTQQWTRLPDMPHGSNRRAVTFADRWVLLVAGYKYPQTWLGPEKQLEVYSAEEKARDWKQFFEKTVLVFDTVTGRLGSADPLLDQTSWPMLAIEGDTLYSLGGEGGARLWHPATLQVGKIRVPDR